MKYQKPILAGVAILGLILFLSISSGISYLFLIIAIAALSLIPEGRIIRAAFGTAVLAALIFFVTQILSKSTLGRQNIDLTEDSRYTLTKGTKAILAELDEPVTINYYVTRDLRSTPAGLKRYIPRVDNLLEEFEGLAKDGNLTVNFVDPKPNTDEEDAAALDQIQRVPVSQDEELFFGASVSAWDKKTVIPFFDPQNETQLEFDLISAIAEVSRLEKPVVGLVTALDMTSGGETGRGWLFYQYLNRQYRVADLGMGVVNRLQPVYEDNEWGEAPDYIDPDKIPVLLVVHPADIAEEAEYALDQYLLRGGTVIAMVDAMSFGASAMGNQRPMMPGMPPQGGPPTQSSLPKLFDKHNITFSGTQVIIDGKYGQPDGPRGAGNPAILTLDKESFAAEDAIALTSLNEILFAFSGAFEKVAPEGLNVTKLIQTSSQSSLISGSEANAPQAGQNLRFKLRSADREYDLAVYLSGKFTTAFPDGDPLAPDEEEPEETDQTAETDADKKDEEENTEENITPALAEGQETGHLYLFADSDMLIDRAAYQLIRIGGLQGGGIPQQVSDNGPLIFNILDQATGSRHLVGARARTPSFRPFKVFKEMQSDFRERVGKEIDEIREKQKAASDRISKLESERKDRGSAFLTAEQTEELKNLRKEEVQYAKNIREKEKEYQASEDAIKSGIFWKSLLTVPVIVLLLGLGVYSFRRISTQAR